VWALGMILLEILLGVPLWLCYKCMINKNGKNVFRTGLFGIKGRDYEKIR
jgi:hypothetical protein